MQQDPISIRRPEHTFPYKSENDAEIGRASKGKGTAEGSKPPDYLNISP